MKMAFQAPNARQESQNRKILEELQQQKKMLMSNKQISSGTGAPGQSSSGSQSEKIILAKETEERDRVYERGMAHNRSATQNHTSVTENHAMTQSQRAALQHAHDNCVGYYITQDSSFGNLILPVVPRFDGNGSMI